MVEPADVGQGNDAAVLGWLDGARLGRILLEREMRPRAVVVAEMVATGLVGSHFHRNHRYPGTRPVEAERFFA